MRRRESCREPIVVTYVLETCDSLMNVAGRELVKLLVVAKDNDGDIDGAEYTQLVSLLEQAAFSLQEGAATTVSIDRLTCKRRSHTQSDSCRL